MINDEQVSKDIRFTMNLAKKCHVFLQMMEELLGCFNLLE